MVNKPLNNDYMPDDVSHPGLTIQDYLEELDMNQAELAVRLGRSQKTVNELIRGKTSITPDTAIQLERVLGAPAKFWLSRQADFDQFRAAIADTKRLSEKSDWISKFPILEMTKQGWFPKFKDKMEILHELLKFFGVASPDEWQATWQSSEYSFRESPAYNKKPEATSVWLRRGEQLAFNTNCSVFNKDKFMEALFKIREMTKLSPEDSWKKLVSICAEAGVAVVFVPPLKGVTVFGVTRWLTPHKALIQLSLRGKFEDIFWFTFFHEACHILKHGKKKVFLESNQSNLPEEMEADNFARDFLISAKSWKDFINAKQFSREIILKFSEQSGISPAIVVGRLHHEHLIPRTFMNDLRRRYIIA